MIKITTPVAIVEQLIQLKMSPLSLLGLTLLLPFLTLSATQNNPVVFLRVIKCLEEYIQTGNASEYLLKAVQNFQLTHLFRNDMENVHKKKQLCYMCNVVVDLVIRLRKMGLPSHTFIKAAKLLCTNLGIASRRLCNGVIDLNADIFVYIVDKHRNLTSNRVCGSVFQFLGCSSGKAFEWSINVAKGNSAERPKPKNTNVKTFNILQLSDVHYDPNYTPNGNAVCGEMICCQGDQGKPKSKESACGYWTDYRDSGVPWHLIEETIRQVNTQKLDYVYFIGDIISHRAWDTSVKNSTWTISRLYSFFKKKFNVPVFPIFGNHESHPINVWPPESVTDERLSMKWLFELAAKQWSELIGEDVSKTVLKGGYYTVSPKPGFRIIAINSNPIYTLNWWLIFDDVDPYGQLQWLADTLKKAEENNESVHILSHVPTGTVSSLHVWGREYSRIVERFSNIITGQFSGHTHKDEFQVYYNSSNSMQPVGVVFNGASLTPYSNSNPSYKIYQVESSLFTLLDYQEWTFNLTLANSRPSTQTPEWYKLYSFRQFYGTENLSPVEVNKVLYKMAKNHSLLDDYFKFSFRNGDPGINRGCNEKCKKANLCDIATTIYGVDTQCKYFLNLYNH